MRPRQRSQPDLDRLAVEIGVDHFAATAGAAERLVSHVLGVDLYNGGRDSARRRRMADVLVAPPNGMDAVSADHEHRENHGGLPELTEDAFVVSPFESRGHTIAPPDRPNVCRILDARPKKNILTVSGLS